MAHNVNSLNLNVSICTNRWPHFESRTLVHGQNRFHIALRLWLLLAMIGRSHAVRVLWRAYGLYLSPDAMGVSTEADTTNTAGAGEIHAVR